MSELIHKEAITEDLNARAFDYSMLKTVPVDNFIAFKEDGRFAGWPANNGLWAWGNEILIGFILGYHNTNIFESHSIRNDMPRENAMLRSFDGGISWKLEMPENYVGSQFDSPNFYKESPGFNFEHPDFAMRIAGERYFISENRGKTWVGPFKINLNSIKEPITTLTSRTDYIVVSPIECFVFMSTENDKAESDYKDRSFCSYTKDGGQTFEFLGWMTHDVKSRSVMSSTVIIGENHLVSSLRRKHIQIINETSSFFENWIDAVESKDNGRTWINLGKVADTGYDEHNGNPPAMVKLSDGRLCVAYGYRDFPVGIRMKVSKDTGKTWGNEIVVRTDAATWDMGYPRMVETIGGKIVLMYYYNTTANPEQHIAVSIIDIFRLSQI